MFGGSNWNNWAGKDVVFPAIVPELMRFLVIQIFPSLDVFIIFLEFEVGSDLKTVWND